MVVISEIQENKGSSETSGVDVVKGQTLELVNFSEDENNIGEKNEMFVINLMGRENCGSDGDDSESESEEMLDDDDVYIVVNESEEQSDSDVDERNDHDEDVEELSNEESNDDISETAKNEGKIENSQDGEHENLQVDIVKNVMEKAARDADNNGSIVVSKHLDLEYDLGTLLAIDTNELNLTSLRNSTEEYLKNLARDNAQLLINKIWELPITRMESEIVAKLPKPTIKIPREKRIPKPKPLTKWQQYAKEKGLSIQKKSRKEWDETLQKWVPRWGYRRVQALKEKNWVIETKKNDNPMVDPFSKMANEKRERVAKNELQRLKNLARGSNIKIPREDKMKFSGTKLEGRKGRKGNRAPKNVKKKGNEKEIIPRVGFLTSDKMDSTQLQKALTVSKNSTASLGKFQGTLPKEKIAKNVGALMPMAKKRRAPFVKAEQEQKANIQILDGILKKRPKLDLEKAVNRHINVEERQRAQEKSQKSKGKGKGKAKRNGGRGKKNNHKGGGNKNSFKRKGEGNMRTGNKSITGKSKRKGGKKR